MPIFRFREAFGGTSRASALLTLLGEPGPPLFALLTHTFLQKHKGLENGRLLLKNTHMSKQGKSTEGASWKAAREYGFDMSLIEDNLRRSPRDRIGLHLRAMQTVGALRAATEKAHA